MSRALRVRLAGLEIVILLVGFASQAVAAAVGEDLAVARQRAPIEVRFVDETGRRWPLELWRLRLRGLSAIATEGTPAPDLPWTEEDCWRQYGVGRWTPANEDDTLARRDVDGRLDVAVAGSVVVSAVLRHVVLESRLVTTEQGFVEFVLSRGQVEAQFVYLRGRVVSQVTRAPYAGAMVGFANMTERPDPTAVDAAGGFELGPVLAGPATLLVEGGGHEQVWRNLALSPGRHDLGTISVTSATHISGRLLAPGGPAVPASVFVHVPEHRGRAQHVSRRSFLVGADATFVVRGVGRRNIVLVARTAAGAVGYAMVDATRGEVTGVEIVVRPTLTVTMTARNPSGRGLTITFLANGSAPVAVARLAAHVRAAGVSLPPGTYRVQIETDSAVLSQRDVVVRDRPVTVDLDL